MDLQWNERQVALRAKYAQIGSRIDHSELHAGKQAFDQDTWDRLLKAGLWKIIVPAEYGGEGTDWWDFTAALEGLASSVRTPGILLSVIAQAGMVHALNLFGTEAQKKDYLGRILKGKLSATAIADPDTGTDVRSTSSVLTPGPNETFVLNGAKYNIAHAPVADFTLVVCKLDGHARDGISLILLDAGTKGLEVGEYDQKLGNLDLPTGPMKFTNIPLHYGDLLGVPGKGLRNLITFVSLGRLYYGLVSAWLVEPMLKEAMRYAQERQTFEVPVLEFQYVQKKLTDMRISAETAKWTAYGALHQLLSGAPEAGMTCSIAKLAGAEAITSGAIDLLKLYGTKGYHQGEVSTFLRDALAFCAVGGTEEMHRRNIISQMKRLEAKAAKEAAPEQEERLLETA